MAISVIDATSTGSTGTVMVSGNMPAFSAYLSASQNISSGVVTKIQFNTKVFDTNSYYDASTNYRFTPLIAGYYQFNASAIFANTTSYPNIGYLYLYKNGSQYSRVGINFSGGVGAFNDVTPSTSAVIYLNGTTDYVEVYGSCTQASGQNFVGGSNNYVGATQFTGVMIRSA